MGWPLTGARVRRRVDLWERPGQGGKENTVSLGFVMGLEYPDPRTDPHHALQSFKQHPFVSRLLEGGKMVRYGAKTIPYGGWWSIPPLGGDGWMMVGDAAGFVNTERLKGIHLAIKSGMLAAETAFEALLTGDSSARQLGRLQARVESSWIKQELYPVRNFHQGFEQGFATGMLNTALLMVTGGHGLRNRYPAHPRARAHAAALGHHGLSRTAVSSSWAGRAATANSPSTSSRRVYHSGTRHEEDQPAHLVIHDTDICTHRCTREYGNPCQFFCPAKVYEMVEAPDLQGDGRSLRIHLNPSNCVHCKACDIMDPYQVITWVPPEGGGGPNYEGM